MRTARELTEPEFERLALSLTEQARFEQAAATVKADQDRVRAAGEDRDPDEHPVRDRRGRLPAHQVLPRRRHPPLRGTADLPAVPSDHAGAARRRQPFDVDTLDDIVNSVHFKFQSDGSGLLHLGYDGRVVNGEGSARSRSARSTAPAASPAASPGPAGQH
jgi:hypothetical protein